MFKNICKQTTENFCELAQNKKIVLWGAVGKNIKKALSQFDNVDCIIDSDSERWGTKCEMVYVYPPEHLYALSPDTHIVLITAGTACVYSITKTIESVEDFDIFYLDVITDKFFCYFSNQLYDNLSKIKKVENSLADDMSKKIYRECVYRRIIGATGEFKSLKVQTNPQYIYLPMFEKLTSNEIFIDCGGYLGDSVEKLVATFGNNIKKIYSFECFDENILMLNKVGEELNRSGWKGTLVIAPYAVSDKNTIVTFNNIGQSAGGYLPEMRLTVQYNEKLAPISSLEVESKTIDSFIPEHEKIGLIKMDIEGAEFAALKGAEKVIKKDKPRLAISLYHNPSDYWRICELIQEFSSDYKFAVRHHANNHLDTVLYAYVEE